MADTITTQRMLSESPEVEAYKLNLLKKASELATTPEGQPSLASQLPGYQIAGFQEPQLTALEAARTQGIGSYMPYIQGAGTVLGGAVRTAGEAADILRGADTRNQFADAQTALQQAGAAAGRMGTGAEQFSQYSQANVAPAMAAYNQGLGGLSTAQQMAAGALPDFGAAQQAISGGIGSLAGATGRFQPSDTAAFMDPYRQQVIDETMKQINRQASIAQQGAAAQAVRSGAFGGMREGVQRAEMERNVLDTKASTIANLLSQGFSQAQAQAMASFEQQQQRQMQAGMGTGQLGSQLGSLEAQRAQLGQAGAGLYGNLAAQQIAAGQGLGQLGVQQAQLGQAGAQGMSNVYGQQAGLMQNLGMGIGQLAGQQFGIGQQQAMGLGSLASQLGQMGIQQGALGQTAQAMGQGDINFLYNIGQAQQALAQQQLDAQRATETQRLYAPYQQAAFLSDIYRGAPSTQMATTAASQPSPSPFQQAAGIAIGAGTAFAGAKKAGLFGP